MQKYCVNGTFRFARANLVESKFLADSLYNYVALELPAIAPLVMATNTCCYALLRLAITNIRYSLPAMVWYGIRDR